VGSDSPKGGGGALKQFRTGLERGGGGRVGRLAIPVWGARSRVGGWGGGGGWGGLWLGGCLGCGGGEGGLGWGGVLWKDGAEKGLQAFISEKVHSWSER